MGCTIATNDTNQVNVLESRINDDITASLQEESYIVNDRYNFHTILVCGQNDPTNTAIVDHLRQQSLMVNTKNDKININVRQRIKCTSTRLSSNAN